MQTPERADPDGLRDEVECLRQRLAEAEDTLRAIRTGEVDALVVADKVYTLEGVDAASNRFRGEVLAQMHDAVVAIDTDGLITYINPAAERQYGVAASQVLGHPLETMFAYRWVDEAGEAQSRESLAATGTWRGRTVHIKRSGERIDVESTVSVLHDTEGARCGLLGVLRDVTEQRRAEEALLEADRRKNEFLATLAHELRNPLAPIGNALHIMHLTEDAAAHRNARAIIDRQLRQLVRLVDDLLDLNRVTQGKIELRREPVDVAWAVQAALETARPLIDGRRHELALRLPRAGTLVVDADPTRLCQAIGNLLNNAAKYTPDGGRIGVTAERAGADAVVVVQDSGVGIAPRMLPRVFDMFAQVDDSLERKNGGLGIGLALVKRLVEMHGGSVEAASEGPGRGSRFMLRLPVAGGLSPASEGRADFAPAPAARDIAVLVVDDNRDSAESLSHVLQLLGYSTRVAHDGATALEIAEVQRPRVLLLDLGMPQMSGIEAARRLRARPWGRDVLLIALSGWGQDEVRRQSQEAGFDHHFVKPVDMEALAALMTQVGSR